MAPGPLTKLILRIGSLSTYCLARFALLIRAQRPHQYLMDVVEFARAATVQPLPKIVLEMAVLAEDRRFYYHGGVDAVGILRALLNNLRGRPLQGGSTIEQQLIRTITGQRDMTLGRKFFEALTAVLLSAKMSKDDILLLFLHCCWLGFDVQGVPRLAASEKINLSELSSWQAAMIAARVRYPAPQNPDDSYRRRLTSRSLLIARSYELALSSEACKREDTPLTKRPFITSHWS